MEERQATDRPRFGMATRERPQELRQTKRVAKIEGGPSRSAQTLRCVACHNFQAEKALHHNSRVGANGRQCGSL